MKTQSRTFRVWLGSLITAGALMLSACGDGGTDQPASGDGDRGGTAGEPAAEYSGVLDDLPTSYPDVEDDDLTIGFSMPNGSVESLSALDKALEKAVEAKGGNYISFDAQAQPDQQVTHLQQLIDRDVDAIIVWPLDAQALNPVIASAKEKDIPVLGVDVNPDPDGDIGEFTSQITAGTDQIGFTAAQEMARVNPEGEIAVAAFVVPVPSIHAWADSMADWAEEFGLDVVARVENQTDDVAGGMNVASGTFASNPDLSGVLAYNDPTAIGATLAARESGRQIVAIGINGGSDALESISQGRLHGTLQFPIAIWAEELTKGAYAAASDPDAELPKTVYPAPLELITSENIDDAQSFDEQIQGIG